MPIEEAERTSRANRRFYDRVFRDAATRIAEAPGITASVIALAACKDNQLARDGSRNGLFTEVLLRTWRAGAFRGDYRAFHAAIVAGIPAGLGQTPTLTTDGEDVARFLTQQPFDPGGGAMSQPVGASGSTGTSSRWGIPRSSKNRDTGQRKRIVLTPTDQGLRASSDSAREAESVRIPAIAGAIETLASGSRSSGSIAELVGSLGEAYVENGRVQWEPPDSLDPTIREYFEASVQELNNYLDLGTAEVDESGAVSLGARGTAVPDGSLVTAFDNASTLYRVVDGRRQPLTGEELADLTIRQSDVLQLSSATLLAIPLEQARSRAVDRAVDTYLFSDLRGGHLLESWAQLEGTTLTTRTITQAVTWFGGWTAGVRFDLVDDSGRLLTLNEPIRYRYGCDARAFGPGRREDTEFAAVPQEIADATESILISHYWDPKRSLIDTIIEAAEVVWWVVQQIWSAQQQGEAVDAASS
jgi:hypothetical protein